MSAIDRFIKDAGVHPKMFDSALDSLTTWKQVTKLRDHPFRHCLNRFLRAREMGFNIENSLRAAEEAGRFVRKPATHRLTIGDGEEEKLRRLE